MRTDACEMQLVGKVGSIVCAGWRGRRQTALRRPKLSSAELCEHDFAMVMLAGTLIALCDDHAMVAGAALRTATRHPTGDADIADRDCGLCTICSPKVNIDTPTVTQVSCIINNAAALPVQHTALSTRLYVHTCTT